MGASRDPDPRRPTAQLWGKRPTSLSSPPFLPPGPTGGVGNSDMGGRVRGQLHGGGGGVEGHSPEPWKGRLQSQDAWVLLSPEPLGANWTAITCPLPQGDTEGSQAGQGGCMKR